MLERASEVGMVAAGLAAGLGSIVAFGVLTVCIVRAVIMRR